MYLVCFVCFGGNCPHWVMTSSFKRFLDHTQRRTTVGRTPLDEWSARCRDLYLTTHNIHNRQTSMPPTAFEPTISAGERPQTYALDRAAGHWDRHISCSQCMFMCCVLFTQLSLIFSLNRINLLFFVRESLCVFSKVKTGILSIIYVNPYLLMWRIRWANNIPKYIQRDAALHSLFISGNCSTCFECYLHPSSGAHTTVSTASGICQTVTAICRYSGR
jgi:hypothetical protein